jgi:cysteine desulfurase
MFPKVNNKRDVYFDHAAATQTDPRVFSAMEPFLKENYGNPSSLYHKGREAKTAIDKARREIAKIFNALPEHVIFTSGGTESDNMALFGVAHAHKKSGKHIISTKIEHHAVLHSLEKLAKDGFEIEYAKVDENGLVDVEKLIKSIKKDTILISVMFANNEIGTIEPIAEIGRAILKYRKENNTIYPFFHTDACQAAGYLDLNVEKTHVDLMTINGSKIYGPKGIGALYLRRGIKINPIIVGGSQEHKMRAGTENISGIAGLAKALKLTDMAKAKESQRTRELSEYFYKKICDKISNVKLNGPKIGEDRLPNNLNVTLMNIEGEALLLYLDEYGIMCSTGSACTSDSLEPSHVLTAIGLPYEMAHGSLRFTLGRENTKEDVDYTMQYLPAIVEKLREISPVNLGKQKHAKYKK